MTRLTTVLILWITSTNALASYMGGPEVGQYFGIVALLGTLFSAAFSLKRTPEGVLSGFNGWKFLGLVFLTFIAAIIAGFVGLAVGNR